MQSSAFRTAGVGSATLPMASLYALAAVAIRVYEIHVTNTTTIAFECSLKRLSSAGTPGAVQTVMDEDEAAGFTARADPRNTHTVAPTLVAGEFRRLTVGATAGSGAIWVFPKGLRIPVGVANGIGVITIDGVGQISDVVFVWE